MLPFLYLCLSRSSKFSKSSTESFCNPYASTLLYFGSSFYYLPNILYPLIFILREILIFGFYLSSIYSRCSSILESKFVLRNAFPDLLIALCHSNDHFLSSIIHTHFQSSNLELLFHFMLSFTFLMLQNIVGFFFYSIYSRHPPFLGSP